MFCVASIPPSIPFYSPKMGFYWGANGGAIPLLLGCYSFYWGVFYYPPYPPSPFGGLGAAWKGGPAPLEGLLRSPESCNLLICYLRLEELK